MAEITGVYGESYVFAAFNGNGEITCISETSDKSAYEGNPAWVLLPLRSLSDDLISSYAKTKYIKDGEVADRPKLEASLVQESSNSVTIYGVPDGAVVLIESEYGRRGKQKKGLARKTVVADGTDILITGEEPGDYLITVKLPPYQEFSATFSFYGEE